MQLADLALRKSDDPHVGEAHALVEASDILLVARKPVEGFRQHGIEMLTLRVGDQLLNSRTKK